MATVDMNKPVLPMIYTQVMIRVAEERGLDRQVILQGLDLPSGLFSSTLSRISANQAIALARRLIQLSGNDPTLGYQWGLRMGLSTAGVLGAAAMARTSVRSAVELMMRFGPLMTSATTFEFFVEDETAVIEVRVPAEVPPELHRYLWDWKLVGLWRFMVPFVGDAWREIELWFDYPEPDYYAQFREQLPRCRFDMGVTQICFPARILDRPLAHGDPVTAELLEEQCRKELALLGPERDVVGQVKAFMTGEQGYPPLESVAERLFMSPRTLKRKLSQQGTGYQQLLDDARREEACALLHGSSLSVEKISERLGFADLSGFSNAFRKWTGTSPGAWRKQALG